MIMGGDKNIRFQEVLRAIRFDDEGGRCWPRRLFLNNMLVWSNKMINWSSLLSRREKKRVGDLMGEKRRYTAAALNWR